MSVIGRPRKFEREAALRASMLVFWRKGYLAASMNDLCNAMGIRSPSLYATFGSKEALYLEAFGHYADTIGPLVWGQLKGGPNARDCIENVLLAAVDHMPEYGGMPAGCMMTLAAVGDEWPNSISDAARKVRADCLAMLRARLGDAIADGELPSSADAGRISRFYLGIIQGMAIQASDGATSDELMGLVEQAMAAWPANPSNS